MLKSSVCGVFFSLFAFDTRFVRIAINCCVWFFWRACYTIECEPIFLWTDRNVENSKILAWKRIRTKTRELKGKKRRSKKDTQQQQLPNLTFCIQSTHETNFVRKELRVKVDKQSIAKDRRNEQGHGMASMSPLYQVVIFKRKSPNIHTHLIHGAQTARVSYSSKSSHRVSAAVAGSSL